MKRHAAFLAVLALASAPAAMAQYVADKPLCVITSTGTSVNSSTVAECNTNGATGAGASGLSAGGYTIRCDGAIIFRQVTTTSATVAAGETLATMGIPIDAAKPWPFGVPATGEGVTFIYFAVISSTGTVECGVFKAL